MLPSFLQTYSVTLGGSESVSLRAFLFIPWDNLSRPPVCPLLLWGEMSQREHYETSALWSQRCGISKKSWLSYGDSKKKVWNIFHVNLNTVVWNQRFVLLFIPRPSTPFQLLHPTVTCYDTKCVHWGSNNTEGRLTRDCNLMCLPTDFFLLSTTQVFNLSQWPVWLLCSGHLIVTT